MEFGSYDSDEFSDELRGASENRQIAGRAISRFANGTQVELDYEVNTTWFDDMANGPEIHDLENVGDTRLRFTTLELLAP